MTGSTWSEASATETRESTRQKLTASQYAPLERPTLDCLCKVGTSTSIGQKCEEFFRVDFLRNIVGYIGTGGLRISSNMKLLNGDTKNVVAVP